MSLEFTDATTTASNIRIGFGGSLFFKALNYSLLYEREVKPAGFLTVILNRVKTRMTAMEHLRNHAVMQEILKFKMEHSAFFHFAFSCIWFQVSVQSRAFLKELYLADWRALREVCLSMPTIYSTPQKDPACFSACKRFGALFQKPSSTYNSLDYKWI